MPLIFAYVFFAWSVVIAVMAWAIEGRFRRRRCSTHRS
jgi:hypothetical protein